MKKLLMFLPALFLAGCITTTSDGQYVGYVSSIEQNGIIWKGWNLYIKTDLSSSQEDMACINKETDGLVETLKQAQSNKTKVELTYHQESIYAPGRCPGQGWMIDEAKVIE